MKNSREKNIELFLYDNLDGEEKLAFLKALESDAQLREDIQLQKMAYILIQKHGEVEIRERIQHWQQPRKASFITKTRAYIGLAIFMVALAIVIFGDFPGGVTNKMLFENYYELPQPIQDSLHNNEDWNAAIQAMKKQQFEDAILLFEDYSRKHPTDAHSHLYIGVCVLAIEPINHQKSQYHLNQAVEKSSNNLPSALWYLSLSYLHEDRSLRAKKYLNMLSKHSGPYAEKGRELLQEISFDSHFRT